MVSVGPSMPSSYDPQAYTVAQAVHTSLQNLMSLDNTVLFGSRARGEHRDDSDIDLLLLVPDRQDMNVQRFSTFWHMATRAGKQAIQQCYNPTWSGGLDLVFYRVSDFQFYRTAPNHMAYSVLQEGIPVDETHWNTLCNQAPHRDPQEPNTDNWPAIRRFCQVAYRNLGAMYDLLDGLFAAQENAGFCAQQAIENALKGWISALGLPVEKIHDLDQLIEIIGSALEDTHDLPSQRQTFTWLTDYAVKYRYSEVVVTWEEPDRVYQQTVRLTDQIIQEISLCLEYDITQNPEIAPTYKALRTTLSDP